MTNTELQVRFLMGWVHTQVQTRVKALHEEDSERGDGILVWVIMVALLATAAIAVVAIIVGKAKDTANNTNTQ